MTVSVAHFRKLALALDDASEVPHMERAAFRTTQRIFATLGHAGDVNFRLAPEQQELLCAARPSVFAALNGGWGRMGWTRCLLADADETDVVDALQGAHALAMVKKTAAKKKKKTAKKKA